MTDKYKIINKQDLLADTVTTLNDNFITALSTSSGEAFPTANLEVGRQCYRKDTKSAYILTTPPADDGTGAIWTKLSTTGGGVNPGDEGVIVIPPTDALPSPYSASGDKVVIQYGKNIYVAVKAQDYTDGTIDVAYAEADGVGTLWSSNVIVQDSLEIAGDPQVYTVETVTSDTTLTLSPHVPVGGVPAGTTYKITRKRWIQVIPDADNIRYSDTIPLDTSDWAIGEYLILSVRDGSYDKGFYVYTGSTFLNVLDLTDANINPDQLRVDLLKDINTQVGKDYLNFVSDNDGNLTLARSVLPRDPVRGFGVTLPDPLTYKLKEGFLLTADQGVIPNINFKDLYTTEIDPSITFNTGASIGPNANNQYQISSINPVNTLGVDISNAIIANDTTEWHCTLESAAGTSINLPVTDFFVSIRNTKLDLFVISSTPTKVGENRLKFTVPTNKNTEFELFLNDLGLEGSINLSVIKPQKFVKTGLVPKASGGINDLTPDEVRAHVADGIQDKNPDMLIVLNAANEVGKAPITPARNPEQLREAVLSGAPAVEGTSVLTVDADTGKLGVATLPEAELLTSKELRAKIILDIADVDGTEILTIGNNVLGKANIEELNQSIIRGIGDELPDILDPNYDNDRLFILESDYTTSENVSYVKGFYGKQNLDYHYKTGLNPVLGTGLAGQFTEFNNNTDGGLVIDDDVYPTGDVNRIYLPVHAEAISDHNAYILWEDSTTPTPTQRGSFHFRLSLEGGDVYHQEVPSLAYSSIGSKHYLYFTIPSSRLSEYRGVLADASGKFGVYITNKYPISWQRKNIIPLPLTPEETRAKVVDGITQKTAAKVVVVDANNELGVDEITEELRPDQLRARFVDGIVAKNANKLIVINENNEVGFVTNEDVAGTIVVVESLPDKDTWNSDILAYVEDDGLFKLLEHDGEQGPGQVQGDGTVQSPIFAKGSGLDLLEVGERVRVELTFAENVNYGNIGHAIFTITSIEQVSSTELKLYGTWDARAVSYSYRLGHVTPRNYKLYGGTEWIRLSYVPTPDQARDQVADGVTSTSNRGSLLTIDTDGTIKTTTAAISDLSGLAIRAKIVDGISDATPGKYLVVDTNNSVGLHELTLPSDPGFADYGDVLPDINKFKTNRLFLLAKQQGSYAPDFYTKLVPELTNDDVTATPNFTTISSFIYGDVEVSDLTFFGNRDTDGYSFKFECPRGDAIDITVYMFLQNSNNENIIVSGNLVFAGGFSTKCNITLDDENHEKAKAFIFAQNFLASGAASLYDTYPLTWKKLNIITQNTDTNRGIQHTVYSKPSIADHISHLGANQYLLYSAPTGSKSEIYGNGAHITFHPHSDRPTLSLGGQLGIVKYRDLGIDETGVYFDVEFARPGGGTVTTGDFQTADFTISSPNAFISPASGSHITRVNIRARPGGLVRVDLLNTAPFIEAAWQAWVNAVKDGYITTSSNNDVPVKLATLGVQE